MLENKEIRTIHEAVDSVAAVYVTDLKGNIIYVNDLYCEMMGYEKIELEGKSAKILKSGMHSDEFYKEFWNSILSGNTWRGVFCNKKKSGEYIWLDTIVKPVYDKNQKIESFVGIRINITESVQNKMAIKAQEDHLLTISKLATLGEITSYIAHEINNPLTIMSLALSSLNSALKSDPPDIDRIKKSTIKMDTVLNRIFKIILALRNFSRDESLAKMQLYSIKDIMDDVLLMTTDVVKSGGISMKLELEVNDDLMIKCHKTQVSQVLINLIKNACDAISSLEKREVRIKLQLILNNLEVRVFDSGPEITDEVASHLFESYFTTKKEGKGTGIGLTISSKIALNHGGQLFLDRSCEQTCFVMSIPLEK